MQSVVRVERLCKSYGETRALRDLGFELREGEVLGFLGPNGAGKTTTLRILLGLLRPTSGRAEVLGHDAWRESVAVRRRVGYLPGDVRLYDGLTGRSFLDLLVRLRGGDAKGLRRRYAELADRLRLDLTKKVRAYSKGNKQKLGIVQALMHRPELLILDEPTSALDPLMQEEVYGLLRECNAEGASILFSSHVLPEVEKVCRRVAIIGQGELLELRHVDELRELESRRVRVRFPPGRAEDAARELAAAGYRVRPAEGPESVTAEGEELLLEAGAELGPLVQIVARHDVTDLTVEALSLEEMFHRIYRDQGVGR